MGMLWINHNLLTVRGSTLVNAKAATVKCHRKQFFLFLAQPLPVCFRVLLQLSRCYFSQWWRTLKSASLHSVSLSFHWNLRGLWGWMRNVPPWIYWVYSNNKFDNELSLSSTVTPSWYAESHPHGRLSNRLTKAGLSSSSIAWFLVKTKNVFNANMRHSAKDYVQLTSVCFFQTI